MKNDDFNFYVALIDELNDCVKAALYFMKNANYSEPCKLCADAYIKHLASNASLMKLQIENAIQDQMKTLKKCDTQR